jgi:glycosyltransferase involved in cell wall biosynthesis
VLVDVVLPCRDRARALPWVLRRVPEGYRPIVVDTGSTDGSAEIARLFGARVVVEPRRAGYAWYRGLCAATGDVVCFCSADGSCDPRQLPLLAVPVLAGDADLVIGSRRPTEWAAWPPHARLASRARTRKVVYGTGLRLRDAGPMRAVRRDDLLALAAGCRPDREAELLGRVAAAGWRIREVAVDYRPKAARAFPSCRPPTHGLPPDIPVWH